MAAAVAAALVTSLAGGCAAIPSSGTPQSTPTPGLVGGGGGGQCCEPFLRGPQPGWTPEQVVSGFLLASAFFDHHNAIAREYLTSAASKLWDPHSPVAILAQTPKVAPLPDRLAGGPQGSKTVVVTGQELATLNRNGQYIPLPQGPPAAEDFLLQDVKGRYLITGLPPAPGKVSHELLLSDYLFQLSYAPRNLYYYGLRNGSLVPDPVFVPAKSSDVATALVSDLLHSPSGWLRTAVRTAFPQGARLRSVQALPGPAGGKTAIVDIGLPKVVSQGVVRAMATQLVATLTSPSYSPALFQTVELKVNGHFWPLANHPEQAVGSYWQLVPHWHNNTAVYYLTPGGSARMLSRLAARGVAVPGQAGSGGPPLAQIAVSPDGKHLAGIAGPPGTVYSSELATGSRSSSRSSQDRLHVSLTGRSFTGMSWDSSNDLWVTGRRGRTAGLWVLPSGEGAPLRVRLPARTGPVSAVRVAPDGVRVAMIAGRGRGAHLLLGAVVRQGTGFAVSRMVPLAPNLTSVSALTWYDEDHLLVVNQERQRGPRLWEVPANGNGAQSLGRQPEMMSVTAAGPKNPLYLSLTSGRVEKSVGLAEPWTEVTAGRAAIYPG
jgi:lipoprotein LpqB-like beta-propeller protein/sporulation and spore germination protein